MALSLLLVTGASGAGKSAVCTALAGRVPGVAILDADLLWDERYAKEASGTAGFCSLWLRVCREVAHDGRSVALFGAGTGVPANLDACPERRDFGVLHHLALVCDAPVLRARLQARPAWRECAGEDFIARQIEFDAWLREADAIETLDTTHARLADTSQAVRAWIEAVLARRP